MPASSRRVPGERSDPDVYTPVAPTRVLDTRTGASLRRGSSISVDTHLPDARAVGVQITAVSTGGPGYLTVWNGDGDPPDTSVLNYRHADDVTSNFVIVATREGRFRVHTSEATDVIVDVVGHTTTHAAGAPSRITDTRRTGGTPARTSITVTTGLPPGTPAAAVQLTVTDTKASGYVTAWSGRGRRPRVPLVRYPDSGKVAGNFVIVPLAADASFEVYTSAAASIVVDLMGSPDWYTAITPQRVYDDRPTGGSDAGTTIQVATNLDPAVTAVAVQLTAFGPAGPGYLTAWDGTGPVPDASTVNCAGRGKTEGNFTIVPVRNGRFSIFTSVDVKVAVDVMGHVGRPRLGSHDVPDPNASTLLPDDVAVGAPDVTHRYGRHRLQRLDVHRGTTGRTLVWLHGGGWEAGDTSIAQGTEWSTFNRVPRLLHSEGWTVVSVGYRLCPEVHLEEIVADFYAALVAVGANAEAWDVDFERLVVGGFSAGAHIAGLGATALDEGAFDPPRGLPRIRAILSQDGNMMSSLFAAAVPPGTVDAAGNDLSPVPAIARLLGFADGSLDRCPPERIAQSDIVTYSDPGDPPLYLIAGTHSLIPFAVQTRTRDLVRAAGQIVVFDGVDTGPESGRTHDVQGLNWAALRAFLDAVTS